MPENSVMRPRAVIFGCAGPVLENSERQFFRDSDPAGFILFARNCQDPDQVRGLVTDMRECVGRGDAPVLIDQEGGRVQRLTPPHWRDAPAANVFAAMAAGDPDAAIEAARLNARLIAADLSDLGITVNCAPVLDIPGADADPVIGDRAAGRTPGAATVLGDAVCQGLLAGGVLPVIKHVPGHGRASVDSHKQLPVVDASLSELQDVDFPPFRALKDMPWAMTAHVIYMALDAERPASTSPRVIAEVIRGTLGFQGVLVSDDLGMQALSGSLGERAALVRAAGCDLALHCGGDMAEMEDVAASTGPITNVTEDRLRAGEARRTEAELGGWERDAAVARLRELLNGNG